jgi:hypothetical protein
MARNKNFSGLFENSKLLSIFEISFNSKEMKKITLSFNVNGQVTQTYLVEDHITAEDLKEMIEEGDATWDAFAPDVIEGDGEDSPIILATIDFQDNDIEVNDLIVTIEEDGQE